jgi:hypothetical protein
MRVLIFGTVFVDSLDKKLLVDQWDQMHHALNPDCDKLLIDSASIHEPLQHTRVHSFADNIGHLARGGHDGWGRAFCAGLDHAIDEGYDWVVHIEGDSLFRLPVLRLIADMEYYNSKVGGVPVRGTHKREVRWLETGIVFMKTSYLAKHEIAEKYNWRDGAGKKYPNTPEAVLAAMFADEVQLLNIKNMRDDMNVLTVDNVHQYDWISHTDPEIYDAFFDGELERV